MITSIRLVNFKNFIDETLRLGPFTMIVGTNASGKSNIRDAFRFLHGIGRGYTLTEIIGGKWEWQPIRGAVHEFTRLNSESSNFELHMELQVGEQPISYSIGIGFDPLGLRHEIEYEALRRLLSPEILKNPKDNCWQTIYETKSAEDDEHWIDLSGGRIERFARYKPILTQLDESVVQSVSEVLAGMRFWDLSPELMRKPGYPNAPLGDRGENLPAVLEKTCADPQLRSTLVSWLQELTPMDVSDLEFPRDPSGHVHLLLCEKNKTKISADGASDGTLRFLTVLAALLGKDPPSLCFFEEIDNGIHPARLNLLMELIERQTEKRGIQVLTTTHASTMLTVMSDSTFANTSVVSRLEDSADAIIRRVADLDNAPELRHEQGIGRLHESGWLEDVLFFTERPDEEDDP